MPWKKEQDDDRRDAGEFLTRVIDEAAEVPDGLGINLNGQQPNDTVYASDLPDDFDEKMLRESFGGYGSVQWSKILSKTFGTQRTMAALVQYSTVEEAVFIIENPDVLGMSPAPKLSFHTKRAKYGGTSDLSAYSKGSQMGPVVVPHIVPSGYSGSKGGSHGSGDLNIVKKGLGRGNILPASNWASDEGAVFVGGLPPGATDLDLYEIFSPFGAIPPRGVKVMKSGGGACSGFGFVDFIDPACAQAAIAALDNYKAPDGTTLAVRLKTPGRTKRYKEKEQR
mmetsp:Transcript_123911/g.246670  ORF Transcript_123911/g.246670 Transcript_123911/m.246670 type:complete len:281 (-) Transcript_123911:68-910(-)